MSCDDGAVRLNSPGKRQLAALKASITEFGILEPILIDPQGKIVAGYGVWLAAKDLGMSEVPVISVLHLSEGYCQTNQQLVHPCSRKATSARRSAADLPIIHSPKAEHWEHRQPRAFGITRSGKRGAFILTVPAG